MRRCGRGAVPAAALLGVLSFSCASLDRGVRGAAAPTGPVIAVYGDSQSDHAAHRRVVAAVRRCRPVMVLHAGDMVDRGDSAADWEAFRRITRELRREALFYPARGNHEGDSARFYDCFALPGNERWYAVGAGPVDVYVLDSEMPLSPGSGQYRWLEERLGRSDGLFRVVVLHRPPVGSGDDDGTLLAWLGPLFRRYRVTLVLSGHRHNYERSLRDGVTYVVTGGGGGELEEPARANPYRCAFRKVHHFCALSRRGDTLVVTVYDTALREIDRFECRGGRIAAPCP